jgi:hypothetical protein
MTNAVDLFGEKPREQTAAVKGKAKRKDPRPKGYAGIPGTGPAGQTCGSCEHVARLGTGTAKTYIKCKLMERLWTHGRGSDVLARSPACSKWE